MGEGFPDRYLVIVTGCLGVPQQIVDGNKNPFSPKIFLGSVCREVQGAGPGAGRQPIMNFSAIKWVG